MEHSGISALGLLAMPVPLGTPPYARASLRERSQGFIVLPCFCLREKETAKKEKGQESESTSAAREVQGLMDTVGEPLISHKGRPALGLRGGP